MKDFQLLFCIISLFVGISSISISSFIYSNNTKKVLKFFIGLNLSFFTIQSSIALWLYSENAINSVAFVLILAKFLDVIGTTFSCLFGLFFVNYLFGIKITSLKKITYISIFAFQLVAISIYYLFNAINIFESLAKTSLIVVIAYEIFIMLRNYNQIKSKDLKKAIKTFILITIIFFPLIILESYRSDIEFIKNIEIIKILALPSYFLVINIFSLIFTLTYFNAPAFVNNNKLTYYFKQKFCITEKEAEIIELIMEGITYKQIAEKLFISPKTVDNHIQNIYKKLSVNSKIQLSNFVRSNER